MRENLSQTAVSSLIDARTKEIWLILIELDFNGTTVRVVNDSKDHTSGGNVHTGYPFKFTLPVDAEDEPPAGKLMIDNVSHSTFDDGSGGNTGLIYWFRQMTGPVPVTARAVLASDPNTVEIGPMPFHLREINYDVDVIQGELAPEQLWEEAWPAFEFTPYYTPGLFGPPSSTRGRSDALELGAAAVPGGFPAETPEGPRRRRGRG